MLITRKLFYFFFLFVFPYSGKMQYVSTSRDSPCVFAGVRLF